MLFMNDVYKMRKSVPPPNYVKTRARVFLLLSRKTNVVRIAYLCIFFLFFLVGATIDGVGGEGQWRLPRDNGFGRATLRAGGCGCEALIIVK